jgi:probable rRNA maturation factor
MQPALPMDVAVVSQTPLPETLTLRMERICRRILSDTGFIEGKLEVSIVDDATIQALNREHLDHDWPTDVLSFPLETRHPHLEAEIIVSHQTAEDRAAEFDQTKEQELLLYVIHGTLHLVGYDDQSERARTIMNQAEQKYFAVAERQC